MNLRLDFQMRSVESFPFWQSIELENELKIQPLEFFGFLHTEEVFCQVSILDQELLIPGSIYLFFVGFIFSSIRIPKNLKNFGQTSYQECLSDLLF